MVNDFKRVFFLINFKLVKLVLRPKYFFIKFLLLVCSFSFYSKGYSQTDDSVIIPNVFTPNGDGQNDLFLVEGDSISSLSVIIYNRWGTTLHKSSLIREGWDGRTRAGEIAVQGTYFYIITVEQNGVFETYKGTVTLLR